MPVLLAKLTGLAVRKETHGHRAGEFAGKPNEASAAADAHTKASRMAGAAAYSAKVAGNAAEEKTYAARAAQHAEAAKDHTSRASSEMTRAR